jgi:hypothetical protein
MFNAHLSYLKEKGVPWFNPCNGLMGFWNEYRQLKERLNKPHHYIWTHRDLKRAKEIYAISIIAKVMEQQEKRGPWWILKPKSDPPDGVIGTLVEKNGIQKIHVREIEVVEHLQGNVLDTIKTKLSKKHYEPNTVLVCYVSCGGEYDFKSLADEISKEITSLDHIFLVFTGQLKSEISLNTSNDEFARTIMKVSLVQIKPVYSVTTIDPIGICENWMAGKEGNFYIFEGLGKGGTKSVRLENPPKLF